MLQGHGHSSRGSALEGPPKPLPAQQEPHPGCSKEELCCPPRSRSPRRSEPATGAQGAQDAAGKCFNLNHALIFLGSCVGFFFFNRIITADISAHVRFYYIFVVILQALNFGPQLSWQSSPKTSVPSYSPSSAPAESWRLKMLQRRVLFATEKVLIPDPNRSVNIYCLDVSTGPPHTCRSQQTPRRSSILLQKTGCLSPGSSPPLKHGPVARRRLIACSVTAKSPSKSPV